METINNIELTDESVYPDEVVLRAVLEESYESYCALLDLYDRNGLRPEWRYYRDGKAWLCKVQHKSRTIVWMSAGGAPCRRRSTFLRDRWTRSTDSLLQPTPAPVEDHAQRRQVKAVHLRDSRRWDPRGSRQGCAVQDPGEVHEQDVQTRDRA